MTDTQRKKWIILVDDESKNGSLLVAKGQEISSYTILLLRNYDSEMGVRQPVKVYV